MYQDRTDAGRDLAIRLAEYRAMPNTIVLGIPRGGVVVAAQVALVLELPLDIVVVAKVGAPGNPEYAIGAVAPDGGVIVNPSAGYSIDEVERASSAAHGKVDRYLSSLRTELPAHDLSGATVLLIDDGLATGLTARAAVEWLRRQGAAHIVVAVPVASASAVNYLSQVSDEVVAASVPAGFRAVGQFYARFEQTSDDEVRTLLGLPPQEA